MRDWTPTPLDTPPAGGTPVPEPEDGVIKVRLRSGVVRTHVGSVVVCGEVVMVTEVNAVNYRHDDGQVSFEMIAKRRMHYPLRAVESIEELVPVDGQVTRQVHRA
jgi:hypothetical protein